MARKSSYNKSQIICAKITHFLLNGSRRVPGIRNASNFQLGIHDLDPPVESVRTARREEDEAVATEDVSPVRAAGVEVSERASRGVPVGGPQEAQVEASTIPGPLVVQNGEEVPTVDPERTTGRTKAQAKGGRNGVKCAKINRIIPRIVVRRVRSPET